MTSVEKSENEKKLYKEILQSIKEITALCGTEDIQDTSLGLNDEEYEIYEKECKNIIHAIGDIVRSQEKPFDFTPLLGGVPDEGFWKDIKEAVERMVKSFLAVIPYRKLDEQTRLELLEKSFGIIYLQRESGQFLSKTLGDPLLSDAIYEILMESEFMIVSNYASERRFKNFLSRKVNLEHNDLDLIWDLYQRNFSTILTAVSLKNHIRLVQGIKQLTERIDELEDLLFSILED